jgi:hypothetical protein
MRVGRVAEALDRFVAVRASAQVLDDLGLEARAINNIGNCHTDMGDHAAGLEHLFTAVQLFSQLNLSTEVLRVRWKIGAVALASGDYQSADQQLTAVSAESAVLGLDSDVALIKLDLAEAKLMLGDSAAVTRLCTDIMSFFRAARMITGALTAAEFLVEAARQELLTRRHLDHVRRFVQRLKDNPAAVFRSPPE